jgi:hypothetical protein
MKEKILDVDGNKILLEDAVKDLRGHIRSKEDCLLIRGKYIFKKDKILVIDLATGNQDNCDYLGRVVSDFSLDGQFNVINIKYGWTSLSKYSPILRNPNTGDIPVANLELLQEKGFEENIKTGVFEHPKALKYNTDTPPYLEANNVKKLTEDKLLNYKNGTDSPTYLITEGLQYTFGVEIETSSGILPNYLGASLNYKTVRDGSVDGGEYVTGVLKGDKGFENAQNLSNELAKRTAIDKKCGLHVHVGGASFNQTFIVSAYMLGLALEKELYAILPPSRRNNEYCRALPKLDFDFTNLDSTDDLKIRTENYYNEIFKLLAKTYPSKGCNKFTNHPRGARCGYDHSTPRYCWLNFVPAVFNTKGGPAANEGRGEGGNRPLVIDLGLGERRNAEAPRVVKECNTYTLEFRSHSGTTNFTKIKNWIKICMAFVNFADNHYNSVIKGYILENGVRQPITLKKVIEITYPKTNKSLLAYIDKRVESFNSGTASASEASEYSKVKKESIKKRTIKEMID